VVTSTIVFEDERVKEYVGGYDDWLQQRPRQTAAAGDGSSKAGVSERREPTGADSATPDSRKGKPKTPRDRLSYREKQELAALPARIERLEAEIEGLHQAMSTADFYKRSGDEIARETAALRQLEDQLAEAYHRWEALEDRA
jgi:ATP-binding cassette subfamily F protein uup